MPMKRALQVIFAISVFGLLFSGVLTYHELFGVAATSCPAPGAPGTVLGYPACVYGFFMYLMITIIATLGLRGGVRDRPSALASATGPGTPPGP
jgi:uncharacterized membrane protein